MTKGYVDQWWDQVSTATMQVSETDKAAKVTYRGEDGSKFAVLVKVKPNPIGFRARLPGDAK